MRDVTKTKFDWLGKNVELANEIPYNVYIFASLQDGIWLENQVDSFRLENQVDSCAGVECKYTFPRTGGLLFNAVTQNCSY